MTVATEMALHVLAYNLTRVMNIIGMAILGHRSVNMAMHYTKRADQHRRARAAMEKWEQSGKPKNVARS